MNDMVKKTGSIEMKTGSWLLYVVCVGCVWLFSGCGEQSSAPEKSAPAKPAAAAKYAPAQTIPGRAIERGNALDDRAGVCTGAFQHDGNFLHADSIAFGCRSCKCDLVFLQVLGFTMRKRV